MRKIAKTVLWLYPLLFLLDGSFSVIDDATAFFIPLKLMSTLRNSFAYIVLFMTVPFIFHREPPILFAVSLTTCFSVTKVASSAIRANIVGCAAE